MTREEYKRRYVKSNSAVSRTADIIIDYLFDDFESRTCENCTQWGQCTIRLEDGGLAYFSKDFGCNKFKRKE